MNYADSKYPENSAGLTSNGSLRVGSLLEFIKELDLVNSVSLLTLFLAEIFGFENWLFQVVARICLLLFFLSPQIIQKPFFWLALSLSSSVVIFLDWPSTDNHKFLLAYWLWVLFIAHLFNQPPHQRQAIRINARFFLCLVFLGAGTQKLASPSYRSGAMFEQYLYIDSRFTAFDKLVGIDPSVPDAVRKKISLLRSPFAEVEGNELQIPGSDRARAVALVLSWWDVSFQLLIGVLLLVRRRMTDQIAHLLLLFFIFTTYIPAPVFGFGWILGILGFTLAKERFPKISAVYILAFLAILVYQVPWRNWVLGS